MLQRGRKAPGQSIVGLALTRIEVPPTLTPEQAEVFMAITGTMPSDWFDPSNAHLLTECVFHICQAARLRALIENFDTECLKTEEGHRLYEGLAKSHERHDRRKESLSRSMRLTQQAKYRADAAATASKKGKTIQPWEVDEDEEVDES